MIEGTLNFKINKEKYGFGFKDEQLKKGELVPVVSLMHKNTSIILNNNTRRSLRTKKTKNTKKDTSEWFVVKTRT